MGRMQQNQVLLTYMRVQYYFEKFVLVNIRDQRKNTPLHYAAISSACSELLPLLLESIRKKDNDVLPYVNARNSESETPLMWALCAEYFANVKLLISVGNVPIIK